MQATAINNLKKAKGVDQNKESTPQGSGKGDLLQVRVSTLIIGIILAIADEMYMDVYLI